MDVTCGKCRTEYEFDETLISESGTTVKCTSCGHLFRIFRPGTPESSRLSSWMLRQPDGSVYTFERLATLQRWIAEGKASREDSVSRTGESWKPLGEIAELAPFFDAAGAVRLEEEEDDWPDEGPTIQRPPSVRSEEPVAKKATMTGYGPPKAPPPARRAPGRSAAPPAPAGPTERGERPATPPGREEPDLAGLPAGSSSEAWEQGALLEDGQAPAWTDRPSSRPTAPVGAEEPAWTEGRLSRTASIDVGREDLSQRRGPRVGLLVSLGLVVVVLLGAGLVWLVRPDVFRSVAGQIVSSEGADTASQAYLRGREYFLLDTDEGFEQADREYHRAGDTDGMTRAGLAEIYTVWAQYYLDEVADARLRAKTAGPTEAAALEARADVRQDDFAQKLGQARRFVDAALKNAPEAAEAHRAAADYYRLAGDLDKAKSHSDEALEVARRNPDVLPETEYVAALVDLAAGAEPSEVVGRLRSIVNQNAKLIRCHHRLARLYAARGDRTGALASLARVIELSPDHGRARELRTGLQGTAPLVVAVASAAVDPGAGQARGGEAGDAGPADAGPTPPAPAATAPTPGRRRPPRPSVRGPTRSSPRRRPSSHEPRSSRAGARRRPARSSSRRTGSGPATPRSRPASATAPSTRGGPARPSATSGAPSRARAPTGLR